MAEASDRAKKVVAELRAWGMRGGPSDETLGLAFDKFAGDRHEQLVAALRPFAGQQIDAVCRAIEDYGPYPHPNDEAHIEILRSVLATLPQHERAMAALRDEALIERIVRADFLQWSVYGGYDQETREREWERMKRIELDAFRRRLASLRAALDGEANTVGDAG